MSELETLHCIQRHSKVEFVNFTQKSKKNNLFFTFTVLLGMTETKLMFIRQHKYSHIKKINIPIILRVQTGLFKCKLSSMNMEGIS